MSVTNWPRNAITLSWSICPSPSSLCRPVPGCRQGGVGPAVARCHGLSSAAVRAAGILACHGARWSRAAAVAGGRARPPPAAWWTAPSVDVPGPKRRAVLALLAMAGAARSPSTTWSTRCGRRPARVRPPGDPEPRLPAAWPISDRRRTGWRRSPAATGWARRRRAGPRAGAGAASSAGPARRTTRAAPWPCCARARACGAGRCWPTCGGGADRALDRGVRAVAAGGHRRPGGAAGRRRPGRRRRRPRDRQRCAADPLREPAALLLMRALAAVGAAGGGAAVGPGVRQRLAEETGLDPSAGARRSSNATSPAARSGRARRRRAGSRRGRRPGSSAGAEVAALHRVLARRTPGHARRPGRRRQDARGPRGRRPRRRAATVAAAGPGDRPAALPHALAAALNLNVVQGDVLAACTGRARRPARAAPGRQLRAPARRRPGPVAPSCRLPPADRAGHQPGAARPARRAHVRLAPLPLPGADDDPAQRPVRRGVPRAGGPGAPRRRGRPRRSCALVADIVRRLDGMPLAIELAASRLSAFSLRDLHDRLDRSLDLLGAGGPPATPGTARCARPSSGPTGCSPPTSSACSGTVAPFVDGRGPGHRRVAGRRARACPATRERARPAGRRVDDRRPLRGPHPVPDAGDAARVRSGPDRRGRGGRRVADRHAALGRPAHDWIEADLAGERRARSGRDAAP